MADAVDSKSTEGNLVGVRLPSPAPILNLYAACYLSGSGLFLIPISELLPFAIMPQGGQCGQEYKIAFHAILTVLGKDVTEQAGIIRMITKVSN